MSTTFWTRPRVRRCGNYLSSSKVDHIKNAFDVGFLTAEFSFSACSARRFSDSDSIDSTVTKTVNVCAQAAAELFPAVLACYNTADGRDKLCHDDTRLFKPLLVGERNRLCANS
jgi:hypothetical protein